MSFEDRVRDLLRRATADEPPVRTSFDAIVGRSRSLFLWRVASAATAVAAVGATLAVALPRIGSSEKPPVLATPSVVPTQTATATPSPTPSAAPARRPAKKAPRGDQFLGVLCGSFEGAHCGAVGSVPKDATTEALQDFLDARVKQRGAERFLSKDAKQQYDDSKGGLKLYPSSGYRYDSYDVCESEELHGTKREYWIGIQRTDPSSGRGTTVYEYVAVGRGESYDGDAGRVVLRAEAQRRCSVDYLGDYDENEMALSDRTRAVMRLHDRRIGGRWAEEYLASSVKSSYDSHEGSLYLYSPTSNPHYDRYLVCEAEDILDGDRPSGDVRFWVRIYQETTGGGSAGSVYEMLVIGHGKNYLGESGLVVKSAARVDTCGPVPEPT